MKQQYTVLQALRVAMHPAKTFVGKVSKGFDFLGFHLRWLVWAALAALPSVGNSVATNHVYAGAFQYPCSTSKPISVDNCYTPIEYRTKSSEHGNVQQQDVYYSSINGLCVAFDSFFQDAGVLADSINSMIDTGGMKNVLNTMDYGSNQASVVGNTTNNGLSSTTTTCLRAETSMLDAPIPVDSYRMTVFPPVLNADDSTPVSPQLVPDAPIEVQCAGSETYAQCYEKSRIAYNYAACNKGGAGSCGHSTMSGAESLSSTLTVAKGYTKGTVRPVSLSVGMNSGDEVYLTTVSVTATAAAAVVGAQTINVGVSGADITSDDYMLSSPTITIQDGATTGTTTFTVLDDATVESTETATLTLSNPSAGIAGQSLET